ncbi:hypothetical protein K788_0002082 (plasmid) [Paraburkholderia caribensis MBA4]|uniref:Uncharacterized protein n=1 Tax=Paraburkholderia caribensis MBA4 TaxID=1323664 RepID=A0A0P0RPX8_9BURK|nr:hypothetical protein [Paraburkholderia caribensis]ALL71091.1 hypothetical protein K788_0002082 [Paraburkholderia caribensis MBA4]
MLRLRFQEYHDVTETGEKPARNESTLASLQIQHRWCFGLALAASVCALLAISLGFATFGIAVYVAAILPFAFFS